MRRRAQACERTHAGGRAVRRHQQPRAQRAAVLKSHPRKAVDSRAAATVADSRRTAKLLRRRRRRHGSAARRRQAKANHACGPLHEHTAAASAAAAAGCGVCALRRPQQRR
eukprot:359039-Chlamydomonas_euryale.AAC.2